jgi:hypothetical protein
MAIYITNRITIVIAISIVIEWVIIIKEVEIRWFTIKDYPYKKKLIKKTAVIYIIIIMEVVKSLKNKKIVFEIVKEVEHKILIQILITWKIVTAQKDIKIVNHNNHNKK